jgi:signal transduction histidine kinase/CheY-like chemotaxis protein
MAETDDFLDVIEDDEQPTVAPAGARWKVLVIDDDPAVHDGTRFALYDYELSGQGLEIISAFSAAQGRESLRAHPDTAVVLLDVVMESEGAGLELVDFIRHELKNEAVRIILRTGQPGQAPERSVIVDYDINDYKAKTELTADKLFTTLTAALRSYQQLRRLVETRRGLEMIVEAASTLFDLKSMQRLAEGVLTQIASLLDAECAGILVLRDGPARHEEFSVLAGSGCYRERSTPQSLDPELLDLINDAFDRRRHEFLGRRSVLYLSTGAGREIIVLLEAARDLSETDRALVGVFCARLSIAFDNVSLYEQLQEANLRLEERVAKRTAELTGANRRLAAQSHELQRANRFKSEILGKIAHDLKNPLGVIMGRAEMMADLLAMRSTASEPMQAQIDHIRNSAKRLTGMVDTLIADAMNDALDIAIRREPLNLAALIEEITEANRLVAERKGQRITVSGPGTLLISGDPDRLRDAVDNLLSNAIKYSPVGGSIGIELERRGNDAIVRIRDSGPGLSPEDMSRLFGRFQRLSAKPTAGEGSTGLGLSIAKRIVDLHAGRLTGETAPEGGAIFSIALPDAERS